MTGPQKTVVFFYILSFLIYSFYKSSMYDDLTITGAVLFTIPFVAVYFLAKEYNFKNEGLFGKIVMYTLALVGFLIGYLIVRIF